jgi:hypothetical protein
MLIMMRDGNVTGESRCHTCNELRSNARDEGIAFLFHDFWISRRRLHVCFP